MGFGREFSLPSCDFTPGAFVETRLLALWLGRLLAVQCTRLRQLEQIAFQKLHADGLGNERKIERVEDDAPRRLPPQRGKPGGYARWVSLQDCN
jgi:hypothetical protein